MVPVNWKTIVLASLFVAMAATIGFGEYLFRGLERQNDALVQGSTELQKTAETLRAEVDAKQGENGSLSQSLQAEQSKNGVFASEIGQLSGTVSSLQKLSETDPQLLEKYSKTFFLSENYAPAQLSPIAGANLADPSRTELIHSGVLPFLDALIAGAARDGVKLQIISAYRSFYEQASLKLGYKIIYGAGTANQFSAEQGFSEHQLGTAVDFSAANIRDPFTQFASSSAYAWLTANAWRFGFILSYPKNNSFYQYEPWHWRFVGVSLATKLHNDNEYFYNLTQREIDQYLISFFDQ